MSWTNSLWSHCTFFFFCSTFQQCCKARSLHHLLSEKSDVCSTFVSLKPGMNVFSCEFYAASPPVLLVLPQQCSSRWNFPHTHLCKVWDQPSTHPPSTIYTFAIVCTALGYFRQHRPPPPLLACSKEKSLSSVDGGEECTDFSAVLKSVRAEGDVYQRSMCGALALWPSFRCNGSHMRRGGGGWARAELGEGRGHSDHLLIKTTFQASQPFGPRFAPRLPLADWT